jgi:ADP-ribosylglycohydrolase
MMIGTAVGDAFGIPYETKSYEDIRKQLNQDKLGNNNNNNNNSNKTDTSNPYK